MAVSRRQFLQTASLAGASWVAAPYIHAGAKARRYRTALIGAGWWGTNILSDAIRSGSVQVVALCDADANQAAVAADQISELTADEPKLHRDHREMFDREQIDIAIIATPDHWHALQSISALQHGAHVFVEKPTGHTVLESQAIVRAAREADRVVQVGLHRRIGPHHVSGMKFLKDGNVGNIGLVKMFVHSGGGREAPAPNAEPPRDLDWDLYCGPAPLRPFNRKIHPGGFRNYLDFANGTLGDWGVHWLDQVLWWTEEKGPRKISSTGGRPVAGPALMNDQEQTSDAPDHQVAVYEFESFTAVWEHHRFGGARAEKHPVGCYFYGDKGVFHMGWRDGWTFYPQNGQGPVVHEDPRFDNEADGHNVPPLWADFIQSIERKTSPVANVEVGHRATSLALLGMLAWKAGRTIEWDPDSETIPHDPAAAALLRREYRGEWKYPQ